MFSRLVGWMAPYSGTTGAIVRELEPGRCRVVLRDRRRVRNHLDSIHAVALVNVGELASGLAMITALPTGARSIVVELGCEYRKKARGTLTVTGEANPPGGVDEASDSVAHAEIRDEVDDVVARVRVLWRLAPRSS